ncbi:hypothetical protein DVJ77_00860 [Dyella tabacisoli]|uniref:Uncharacterized protein n=1 Tax=Dyella tabacisoli TaxID=2282381 RepID=A0A369UXW8_9GAMM|nr:hypothetical protein DVJ77_00860 [Dyella tabacisoli]
MKVILYIVSWGFPIAVGCYMYFLFTFISRIKSEQAAYWASIGNPNNSVPSGQIKIMRLIFSSRALPADLFARYRAKIYG